MSKVSTTFILFLFLTISHSQESPKVAPFSSLVKPVIGGKTSFTCQSLFGSPPFHIIWFKDGKELQDSATTRIRNNEDSSMLTIYSITSNHSGNYTCRISNNHGYDSYSSELIVEGPPYWIEKPMDINLHHGEDVTIQCIASGYPAPKMIWKRFDGAAWKDIDTNNLIFRIEAQKLIIKNVDRDINGRYACSASNNIQPDLWSEFSIVIEGKSSLLLLFCLKVALSVYTKSLLANMVFCKSLVKNHDNF